MENCFYNLFNSIKYYFYVHDNNDYKLIDIPEINKSIIIYHDCPDCGYKFSNIKCVCGYIYKPLT
jgi:hypothetical protein